MFGLMKRACGEAHRLHYCGTCKTLGARYGQRSRVTLNHDAVFLAELLSLLRGEGVENWAKEIHSWNCFSLPKDSQPLPLRYAAAATLFLADAKLEDHEQDEPGRKWRWLRRFFSRGIRRAECDLREFGVPLGEIRAILAEQKAREAEADAGFRYWAEPTARVTGLFFAHGAPEFYAPMLRFGRAFGELIYGLDAWEDKAKDARTGQFNALSTHVDPAGLLRALQSNVEEALAGLPLAPADRDRFVFRLKANVAERREPGLPIVRSCGVRERRSWKNAVALAGELRERWNAPQLGAALLLPVVVIAWLAPHYASRTRSYGECLGLSLNLMALGAALPPIAKKKGRCCDSKCGDACGEGDCDGCDACDCSCCECFNCCECLEHCGSCGECCNGCDCGGCDCGGCDCG